MNATITPATGTSQPLFVVFAGLLARAQRPARTERRRLTGSTGLPTDRDHDRLAASPGLLVCRPTVTTTAYWPTCAASPADLARLASL